MASSPTKKLRIRLTSADREHLAQDFGARIRPDALLLPPRRDLVEGARIIVELAYRSGELVLFGEGRVRLFPGLATVVEMEWDEACLEVLRAVVARAGQLAARDTDDLVAPNTEAGLPVDQIDTEDVPRLRSAGDTVADAPAPRGRQEAADVPAPTVVDVPAPEDAPRLSAADSWADALSVTVEAEVPPATDAPRPRAPSGTSAAEVAALQTEPPRFDEEAPGSDDLPPPPSDVEVGPAPELGAPTPAEVTFEPPVEEDGTPSEDLLVEDPISSDLAVDSAPPAAASSSDPLDELDEVEPLLLDEVVEDSDPRTQYAYRAGARDELGPSPAPADALSFEVARGAALPPPAPARELGEVTPLARIELVRRAASVFRAGSLTPPPLDVAARVPPTAIPSKRNRPDLPPPSRRVLGVDPGDVTTRAAIVERGRSRVLPSRRGALGVPSAVFIEPTGKTIVGEPAARKLAWHPEQGIAGSKSLAGRLYCSPYVERVKADLPCHIGAAEEDEVALSIGEHFISLEEIEALVLKEARAAAELALQDQANRAVLLCPSHFGVRQRQALRVAARLAGLHVERVLSTPLAVVFGQLRGVGLEPGAYLVCDVGASGCDVAVVEVGAVEARILASAGGFGGGGRDFDRTLADRVLEEVERTTGVVPGTQAGLADVMQAVEVGKRALSQDPVTRIHVEHPADETSAPFAVEVEIRREEAEARFAPLVDLIANNVRAALGGAGLDRGALRGAFLVGGQSHAPAVRRRVADLVGDGLIEGDRETSAVEGAAWAAAQIESTAPYSLHEALPQTLSVGRREGHTVPVIAAGAALPTKGRIAYALDGEADRRLFLFQGEHGHVETDEPVGRFSIPERFEASVDVELELTVSGLLVVRAVDPVSGDAEVLTEVHDCSRTVLRAHFGGSAQVPVEPPPKGLFARLVRALAGDDEISAG